jgi:hypothetical protein
MEKLFERVALIFRGPFSMSGQSTARDQPGSGPGRFSVRNPVAFFLRLADEDNPSSCLNLARNGLAILLV